MKWETLGEITILIVDDDEFNRQLVVSLLSKISTMHFFEADNGIEALEILSRKHIDMILLDLHMPKMDGYETLKIIKQNSKYNIIPTAIITTDEQEMNKLYALGADDFISKPFKLSELEARTYAHIEKKQYYQRYNQLSQQEIQKELVNAEVSEENEAEGLSEPKEEISTPINPQQEHYTLEVIENSQKEFFYNIAKLLNQRENRNIKVVATLAKALSLLIGYDKKRANTIYYASIIREIGTISQPKQLPLRYHYSEQEKELHYRAILAGYQLFKNSIETEFIKIAKKILVQHKECFNGTGFPKQRKGQEIHNIAYIVSIVETFDALLSEKSYLNQKIHTPQETYEIIKMERGQRFHPKIAQLFLEHFNYFIQLRERIIQQSIKKETP